MTNTSCQTKSRKENDFVLKGAKIVFAVCFAILLVCVALFGGVVLGNKDISNTVLENEQANSLEVAEAGSNSGGSITVARYFTTFGTIHLAQAMCVGLVIGAAIATAIKTITAQGFLAMAEVVR